MKKLIVIAVMATSLLIYACGDNQPSKTSSEQNSEGPAASAGNNNASYDTARGEGKFKSVDIPATLDQTMASAGEEVYNVKCASCHRLSDEKLVGPGWMGVTQRHRPEWIMNFVTNTDEMLAKDPKAQAQLEVCLVRMPNQNVSDEDARRLYEFMRKNDGIK